ncbi:MAG: M3 family metallopeptidase, partial [Candidatus Fimadaptatus sp.]
MRMTKRIAAFLLALVMAMGCLTALAEGNTYPTKWDLTEIYASEDEWMADYDAVMEMLPQLESFRGTLNTAQGLYDYLQFFVVGELTRLENKLYLYANLGYSLDASDPVFSTLLARLDTLYSLESQYNAFAESEIFALPLETRQEIMSDPLLEPLAYYLEGYLDEDYEPFSEETNTALAILSPALGRAEDIFNIMTYVDLPDPIIEMPDGTTAELTDALYSQIVSSDDYDREFKALCNQTALTRPVDFINTFTALLESCIATNWAYAQLDNYETSREAALALSDVDPAIYDMVIEAAHEGAADYQRYLDIHRRTLGLEEQYGFDLADYISEYDPGMLPYDEAVLQVREALSVLGEDYIAHYDQLVSSNHIDAYSTDTKDTGAFSMSVGNEYQPYLLFNYEGYSTDVSTLAHEMGHAIYSEYSAENQSLVYASPTIFTQEVASTTNELLYYTYMMEHAATEDERLFYLENMLSMFAGTFFSQAWYAEFEDAAYQTVEAGYSLDAEELSDLWMELNETYRGDAVKTYPDYRYQWATIPHMYYNYYVYQYATSVAYAASICEYIASGDEGAVEDYLAFLKLGGSMDPADLL